MKIKLLSLCMALLVIGCSKPPEPITLDDGSAISINQNLITKKLSNVPQDPFLKNNNWTYNIYLSPVDKDTLIKNDLVVKTFYLAHNADKIIILGFEATALKYKNYFIQNGVRANIEISPLDLLGGRKDLVNVLFFHKKGE